MFKSRPIREEMMSTNETKMIVSISEMARMVGLSRARFYQLVGTTFPWPLYDIATHRPFFDEDLQCVCLDVRRRNCGIDGKPLMFYSRRPLTTAPTKKRTTVRLPKKADDDNYGQVTEGLKSLGMVVAPAQVAAAITELYPCGVGETGQGVVIRAVFLHLKRQDQADSVGR